MAASDSGLFIDVTKLDLRKYAERPALARALFYVSVSACPTHVVECVRLELTEMVLPLRLLLSPPPPLLLLSC